MQSFKKGFTLVELSIVLVIIGLLIGGILAAQSMIITSKVQALVRQIGQFDVAATNFKTKFNQLPGDSKLMGVVPGDGDSNITSSDGSATIFDNEIGKFWADLSKIGLVNPGGTAYTDESGNGGVDRVVNVNIPAAVDGRNAGVTVFGPGTGKNYYLIGGIDDSSGIITVAAFKPSDVLALDTKIDNGIANTGHVMPSDGSAGLTAGGTDTLAANNCVTADGGDTYNVTETTVKCNISVRMGVTHGVYY